MTDQAWQRLGEMLKLLPPAIRNQKLIDSLWAIDAQMGLDKATGAIVIEAHYKNGSFRLARVQPPTVDFQSLTFREP